MSNGVRRKFACRQQTDGTRLHVQQRRSRSATRRQRKGSARGQSLKGRLNHKKQSRCSMTAYLNKLTALGHGIIVIHSVL